MKFPESNEIRDERLGRVAGMIGEILLGDEPVDDQTQGEDLIWVAEWVTYLASVTYSVSWKEVNDFVVQLHELKRAERGEDE